MPWAASHQEEAHISDPRDALFEDHRFQQGRLCAGITRGFDRRRQGLAVRLVDVLSRDSATWLWQHRLTSRVIEQADHAVPGGRRRGRSGDVAVTN
jgi:hypothetical protein